MSDEITGNSLADRAAQLLLDGVKVNDNGLRLLAEKYTATRDALERVQMSLAGCGVIAGCNTEESFANATDGIHPDYMTASLQSVIDAVRREIDLRAALAEREAELSALRDVISQTASAIGNGARIDKASSLEFIKGLPTEVRLHCTRLRADAYQADEECKAAQAELAKYRSAPTAGYLQGHAFYHKHQTRPVADEVQLIIRPEAV